MDPDRTSVASRGRSGRNSAPMRSSAFDPQTSDIDKSCSVVARSRSRLLYQNVATVFKGNRRKLEVILRRCRNVYDIGTLPHQHFGVLAVAFAHRYLAPSCSAMMGSRSQTATNCASGIC